MLDLCYDRDEETRLGVIRALLPFAPSLSIVPNDLYTDQPTELGYHTHPDTLVSHDSGYWNLF